MAYSQPRIRPREWDAITSLGFWDTNGSPNRGQTTRPSDSQQKKRNFLNGTADHRIKLKESEKKNKYLDLARELKKLWNMKVMVIPIVIGALGTIPKGLVKGLEDLDFKKSNRDYSDYSITKNTKRSPWDLKRFAVAQTPVRNHQLMLVWKTLKGGGSNSNDKQGCMFC